MINDLRITPNDILEAIANLKQVVFEVTDACNLRCRYCAYGDLYFGYDKREDSFLSIRKGWAIIDYLGSIWENRMSLACRPTTYVSFYGGEPLLNMPFIKSIVEYVGEWNFQRDIVFSMTTNAMLLDRHIDYLAEHRFNVLISLDGDRYANGHRITKGGTSSFERVFKNIKEAQRKYPQYFAEHINFNSVLHNLNDVESCRKFFLDSFGKESTITELNTSNIKEDKVDEFWKIYKNKEASVESSTDAEGLVNDMFMENPLTCELLIFLHRHSGNVFRNYSDLLVNQDKVRCLPTGTCIPFGKKMFITVGGKILQCEKISQKYSLGIIDDNNVVHLDFEAISNRFNSMLDKVQNQCSRCFKKASCSQCLYYMNGIDTSHPACQGYMNQQRFWKYAGRCMTHLCNHPGLYKELLTKVQID